jgi:hypothetical protein
LQNNNNNVSIESGKRNINSGKISQTALINRNRISKEEESKLYFLNASHTIACFPCEKNARGRRNVAVTKIQLEDLPVVDAIIIAAVRKHFKGSHHIHNQIVIRSSRSSSYIIISVVNSSKALDCFNLPD